MDIEKWLMKNTERLDGKTVAITGATGGLGRELCRYLLGLGASLVLLDRNQERSREWSEALLQAYPNAHITRIPLDLSDMASVRTACHALTAHPLHVLIHNAGAYSIPRRVCDTGYDNVFQINFVSPYYMTRCLLAHLRAYGGRVVVVGSIAHRYSHSDSGDVDFSGRPRASLVYGNAKRYLMAALPALFEEETEASVALTHPGIAFTGITAHYPPWLFAIIKYPMKLIFMHPRVACLSVLCGVLSPTGADAWWGPWLWEVWGRPKKGKLRSFSAGERARICAVADRIYRELDGE